MEPAIQRFAIALGEVQVDNPVDLLDDPNAWLIADIKHFQNVLQSLPIFSKEELANLTNSAAVYPRLLAYTLAHIKLCACKDKSSTLDSVNAKQLEWSQQDQVALLLDHRSVRDTLLGALSRCKDARKKLLLNHQGAAAQARLDHLQALLDLPEFGAHICSPILSAISVLSRGSGLYPKCLNLQDVKFQSSRPLSGGSFGDVWSGTLGTHAIAIKAMRTFSDRSDISREVILWRQLFHPNVLPFYGVHQWSGDTLRTCLISPWMENGTISQYLKRFPDADRPSLLLDIALGLEYLHTFNPTIIHGDLKGSNILITPFLRACIAGFGLCTLNYDSMSQSSDSLDTFHGGTLLYQAPETLTEIVGESRVRNSSATDIYSFGCVCYEIFLGYPRFSNLSRYSAVTEIIGDRRPARPSLEVCDIVGLDDVIWNLMGQCWQMKATSRPTASKLVQTLTSQLETRGIAAPLGCWDDTVVQLRSTLAEDSLLTRIFSDIDAEDIQHSPSLSNIKTRLPSSLLSSESLISLQSEGIRLFSGQDIIVAVIGPTNTGKSSFINTATGQQSASVGHDLFSGTPEVCAISCPYPDDSGRNIVFLDTPGFDDTERADFDILSDIAKWLMKTYQQKITLTGILYFHSISEARMRGTPLRSLSMFEELCGEDALQNVILTTTMWDEVTEDVGAEREQDLQSKFWQQMMELGCRMARFTSTQESAWDIIGMFDATTRRPVKLQRETVDEGKMLHETSAYAALVHWQNHVIAKLRSALKMRSRVLAEGEKPWKTQSAHLPAIQVVGHIKKSSPTSHVPEENEQHSQTILQNENFNPEVVITWPEKRMNSCSILPSASEDIVNIKDQWKGGCILSVHDSGSADAWIDRHYEHYSLATLRANGIGGPVASMLSFDVAALTIYGSASPQLIEFAEELARFSQFPVIIRPSTEDPSAYFKCHGSSFGDAGTKNEQASSSSGPSPQHSKHPSGGGAPPDGQPKGNDDSGDPPDPDPGPPSNPGTDSRHGDITHSTNVRLNILFDGKDKGCFLGLETAVMFYPIPNQKEGASKNTYQPSTPTIEANVSRLKTEAGHVLVDHAAGALGFLTRDRSFFRFRDYVSLGYDEPDKSYKHSVSTNRATIFNAVAGMKQVMPMLVVGYNHAKSTMAESADDRPSPAWVVEPEPTNEHWNSTIGHSALNVNIYRRPFDPAFVQHKRWLDVKYGMSVQVAAPIQKSASEVAFVYRHQIHCWVMTRPSRPRGIIVIAAHYIPDICVDSSSWIEEYCHVDLGRNGLEGSSRPEVTVPDCENSKLKKMAEGFAFATATAPKEVSWMQRLRNLKMLAKPQKSEETAIIPVQTHTLWGWDSTNEEWKKVVWPRLDWSLKPLKGDSTAAWRLDWRENRNTADATSSLQGLSANPWAGTGVASNTQTQGTAPLKAMIKPDKGKGKEVIRDE